MASEALVSSDVDAGREFVMFLDSHGFPILAAAWIFYSDIDEWRLVIVSPRAAQDLIAAYLDIATWLSETPELHEKFDMARMKIASPKDPMFNALSGVMHVAGVGDVRFSNNMINGVYIEDAYIYRMTKAAA